MSPEQVLRDYFHAKDENRPHLLASVFAEDSRLQISSRSSEMQFPAVTVGLEAIADVLVRRFNQTYENIYSYYMDRPADGAESFACDWLVAMSEKQTRNVRVGCGRYEWTFQHRPSVLATRLVIAIEAMIVLRRDASSALMTWLGGLSYPWSSATEVRARPVLDEIGPVRGYLERAQGVR